MSSSEELYRLLSESLHSEVACPYYRADEALILHIRRTKVVSYITNIINTNGSILDHVFYNFFSYWLDL
jgi:hypothetical protein